MSYLFPLTYNQLLHLSFLPPNQISSDTNPDVTCLPHSQCMHEVLQVNGGAASGEDEDCCFVCREQIWKFYADIFTSGQRDNHDICPAAK